MRSTVRRIAPRLALMVLISSTVVAATPAAHAAPSQGTTLGSWTLSAGGYCVQETLISYSPASLTEGDLFSWAATAALCDPGTASSVGMLRLQASVRTPALGSQGCSWPAQTFSGGSVIATSSSPTGAAAATYFESGDGITPPSGAIGVSSGRTPEALGVCAGTWHVVLTSYVLPASSGAWIKLGAAHKPFSVALSPAFGQPRPAQVTLDDTIDAHSHCVRHTFELYDTTPAITVGDLFEYSDLHQTCDAPGAPPLFGIKERDTFSPPAGCPARAWLLQGPSGSTGGGGAPQASVFMYQYGTGEAPPDFHPVGGGGGGRPAQVIVNCPGTWNITIRTSVAVTSGVPTWVHVGTSEFDVEVLPHA